MSASSLWKEKTVIFLPEGSRPTGFGGVVSVFLTPAFRWHDLFPNL
jgi:hypothetical protein